MSILIGIIITTNTSFIIFSLGFSPAPNHHRSTKVLEWFYRAPIVQTLSSSLRALIPRSCNPLRYLDMPRNCSSPSFDIGSRKPKTWKP